MISTWICKTVGNPDPYPWYPQPVTVGRGPCGDTVGICAVTVAHILPIISAIYLLNFTLVGIKSAIFIDYWDGDRLPTIASDEKA